MFLSGIENQIKPGILEKKAKISLAVWELQSTDQTLTWVHGQSLG
jgi:hypothetical protein